MKKLSTLLLALLATTALLAESFIADGIAYNKLGGDSVEVTSKDPEYSGSVTIPSTVTYTSTTYRVTNIGISAFSDCISLTSINIPNSVTSIGYGAFYGCSSLQSITIPNSVTSIGDHVLAYCSSLQFINVDAANTHYVSVDGILFNYVKDTLIQYPANNRQTAYTIPNSVTSIGEYAFCDCDSLSSITIPNSVISIGYGAFYACRFLQSITIPNSVTSIGDNVFAFCYSLQFINVDAANAHYVSVDGVLFNYAKDTLIQYPVGNTRTSYTIPNSVTCLGNDAFANCKFLSSVTIPNSVTSIGKSAFHGCSALSSVTIPNSVTCLGNDAFFYCTSLSSITIGNSVTNIGNYAFYYCTSLSFVTCYATTPPTCGEDCFNSVDKSIPLYVPTESVSDYQDADQWKDFTNIQAIAAEEVTEPVTTVVAIPNDNSVTITWPTTDGADSYTIIINKGGEPFCMLTFNADGQLTNIAFMAPGRGSNNDVTMAEEVAGGYRFTITGLDPGTNYNYVVDTQNAEGQTIDNYTGSFSTKDTPTALPQLPDSPSDRFTKILHNGHLLILHNNHTYTLSGTLIE